MNYRVYFHQNIVKNYYICSAGKCQIKSENGLPAAEIRLLISLTENQYLIHCNIWGIRLELQNNML